MKQRIIATVAALAVLFFVATIGAEPISAQEQTPIPGTPIPTPTPDIEGRITHLEVVQTHTIESLRSSNDTYRSVVTVFSVLVGLLVAIQGAVSYGHLHRESERDQIDRTGVEQVSNVMNVVQQTLQSRLTAEKQARKEARKAQRRLRKVLKQIKSLEQFVQNFQGNINSLREEIENRASELAQVWRHEFRRKTADLNSFARQFDAFETEFKALEEEPRAFSARVCYIRGIAAHYANLPETAKEYLEKVVEIQPLQSDEDKSRAATAYYYLGLTECNFGNHESAIKSFEHANRLDLELELEERDFLTQVVTAEAYAMMDKFDMARQFIADVEKGLRPKKPRPLRNSEQRVLSRATLIKANMAILEREADWDRKAQRLLERVRDEDPHYYYATATLAQVYHKRGKIDKAQEVFHKAYESIESSNDLLKVTEARSRILLLMVAGMCCRQGLVDEKKAEQHLDEADHLRGALPRMGPQVCTVFSTLSKRNESSDTIHRHIELIRRGQVLL
jgi:tetratricopeptide (TPR) repeat protein